MNPAREVRVAGAVFELPAAWSYAVSKQPGSWSFDLSARHGFNLGERCDPQTGPLGELLDHEKAFVFGFAYRGGVPRSDVAQTPGEFRLDPESLASYETSGCRRTYRLAFEHEGYYFVVHVALASDAGSAVEQEVLDVLNSISGEV